MMIVPRVLNNQQDQAGCLHVNYMESKDFSCAEFRHREKHLTNKVLLTTYLFVVILSGEKIFHSDQGDLHITAGNGLFAQKGAYLLSEINSSDTEYRSLAFFIDDSFISNFLLLHPPEHKTKPAGSPPTIFQIYSTPLLYKDTLAILPYFQHQSKHKQDLLALKLEELFLHILDNEQEGNFHLFLKDLYSSRKQNLLKLMETYYREPITISEIASLSGRSISTFKRDFRKLFNETPGRWINQRRLKHAKSLLISSDKNVSEICFEVGFNNISHFSQLFKKEFGSSPGELKKAKFDTN